MALLDEVKKALRLKNDIFNDEIESLIAEAKKDMQNSGIINIDEKDSAVRSCIKTYCKANFGLDNKDSEKYAASYRMQVDKLSLCGEYNVKLV